ncbi:MAG: zinc ABC transporter substrate-binding protein [Chloroflexales bacterium]|nr:zinc ABC transporter substrate-binding protein [Chloroflexales bacterium]
MKRTATLLLLLPLLLSACGAGGAATQAAPTAADTAAATAVASEPTPVAPAANATAQIRAVTTMSVLADMITQVGGERVLAENIIPVGAGPEDYQPAPQDAQKIAEADIVFFNGHGLEAWLNSLFESAGKPGQPRVDVSAGLQAVDVGGEAFKEGNPHFWMSAAYGAKYAEKIRDALSALDPAGKATYDANATSYIQQLSALNAELKQQAATIPDANRKLVTNHDAFPYFAQEYGFTVVGNILGNPESEPAAGDLARLVQDIKAQSVKAIFSESQFSPKLTDTLSQEAGVTVVANLYTDTLDPEADINSYVDLLRYNMKTVVDALT